MPALLPMPRADLLATRLRLRTGTANAAAEFDASLAAARATPAAYLHLDADAARAAALHPRAAQQPLAGLAFSVKDLFDVAGQPTAAGSAALTDAPAAALDAPAVVRLRAAGGTLLGRTHMSEFAFSGVGTNPHYPALANVTTARIDAAVPRIPGGSSSGAAASVASGAAFIGLGSDTGGSIRIPAALHGIVGFKSTARLVPTDGALPLSTTLDTVCAITQTVGDAILAHEILAARRAAPATRPLAACRLAVARTLMLDALEPAVARAFEDALRRLAQAGARIEEISLPELGEIAAINAAGGFPAAESYAWHRPLLAARAALYDPRVRLRIERGAAMSAWQYIDLIRARHDWSARMHTALASYDAVLSPTVPIAAPPLADLAQSDEAFFRINALLLRNPSVVNLLDGCALTLPCQPPGALPVGLMLWHTALHDDAILGLGLEIEPLLKREQTIHAQQGFSPNFS